MSLSLFHNCPSYLAGPWQTQSSATQARHGNLPALLGILAGSLAVVLLALHDTPYTKFILHCLFRPLGTAGQKTRLDKVCSLQSVLAPF